jgi:carbonic anhydrase/acetyltransferase-like protein (isoleucine patch superfamily)
MSEKKAEANRKRVRKLQKRGVEILTPESIVIGQSVKLKNIQAGVTIGPGTTIEGSATMIGAGTKIKGSATIKSCLIGRDCSLHSGEYLDSVLLDGCSTVGWARVRGHCAWEEGTNTAHNVDTKTTVLGYKTTLGSLINFCNVLMLGGTSPKLEVGAEVGSGTINFNFLPYGATVGALIKPSAVIGSIDSPFLSCEGAPIRYDFVGGHCSIIAPVVIGLNSMIAAKTRVNPGIYGDDVMIMGGNLERAGVISVQRIRALKDMSPKYKILIKQLAVAVSFRKWCQLRIAWAEETKSDDFELQLIRGYTSKVDKFIGALEDYGDNIATYLLAAEEHSRSESLGTNREIAHRWLEQLKPQISSSLKDGADFGEKTGNFQSILVEARDKAHQFYPTLAKLEYSSPEVSEARDYFRGVTTRIVDQTGL